MMVPLFGVSEVETSLSNDDTKLILNKNLAKYSKSFIFLYLKGKYEHTICRNLPLSLSSYQLAANNSGHIKEMQFIAVYEIGWINLINLDYQKANEQFEILHQAVKWNSSFSTYICAILNGSLGDFKKANQYFKDALKIFSSNNRKSFI